VSLFGKYAGTVFDNNDSKILGRIKAYVPKAGFVEFPTDWALPSFPFPGIWYTPKVGAKVWIEFEAGDPDSPIWSGAFLGAPGGASEAPAGSGSPGDIVAEILANIYIKAGNNWEEQALLRIIEAATIKLGRTAVQGLILGSFGLNKYNFHTHPITVGSPSGPPLAPAIFVPATDETQKVKGE